MCACDRTEDIGDRRETGRKQRQGEQRQRLRGLGMLFATQQVVSTKVATTIATPPNKSKKKLFNGMSMNLCSPLIGREVNFSVGCTIPRPLAEGQGIWSEKANEHICVNSIINTTACCKFVKESLLVVR
jgi:hypothetical protein